MPDRYGEPDDDEPIVNLDGPVVDFDSRRRARDSEAAVERARQQRQRLAETREVHAPLSSGQAQEARQYQRTVTSRADSRRRELRIANCRLCDDGGYTPNNIVCDHKDHRPAAARGMAAVREAMGWDDKPGHTAAPTAPEPAAIRAAERGNPLPHPTPPAGPVQDGYGAPRPSLPEGGE